MVSIKYKIHFLYSLRFTKRLHADFNRNRIQAGTKKGAVPKKNERFTFMTFEGFTTLKVLCARINSLKMKWTQIMGLLRAHFVFVRGQRTLLILKILIISLFTLIIKAIWLLRCNLDPLKLFVATFPGLSG